MRIDYPRSHRTNVLRFWPSWRQWLSLVVLGFVLALGAFAVVYASVDVPQPNQQALAQKSTVYYRDGKTVLGSFGDVNRSIVPLDQISPDVQNAVIAAEDRSFRTNSGISPKGIARAFVNNMRSSSTQGGSTITQQYVKNVYLTQDRTLKRKLKEFVLSVKINKQNSKDKILEDYLNTIYWGRGSYGVEAASQAWFGISASDLSVSQAAFLGGIIQSPSRYDPAENPTGAKRRWNYVLDGLQAMKVVDAGDRAALEFPKTIAPKVSNRLGGPKGYLLATVKKELQGQGFEDADIESGGLKIITTFQKKAQESAVKAVKEEKPTRKAKGVHIGLTSIVPGTGEVIAMYGGPDYVSAPGQNAALAQVPGGSTFKAFSLAAALQNDRSLTTRYEGNSPLDLPGGGSVRNELGTDYGSTVTLRKAIEESINTAFVDLTLDIGPDAVRDAAVSAGLPEDLPGLTSNPLITLGTASVNSLQLANAYATFAAEGKRATPHTVRRVLEDNGGVRYEASTDNDRAFDEDVASDVTDGLRSVVEDGTGTRAQQLGRPAAGKTGTATNDNGDVISAWFVGYTPQLATAVEYYKGDGRQKLDGVAGLDPFTGGRYPTLTWTAYMKGALKGTDVKDFPKPAHLGGEEPTRTATPTTSPTPTITAPATPTEVATSAAPPVTPTSAPSPEQPSVTPPAPAQPTPPVESQQPPAGGATP